MFMAAAVNALCSALSDINSAIHLMFKDDISDDFYSEIKHRKVTYAIVNGTTLPPIEDTI